MLALGRLYDLAAGVVPLDLQTARTGDYVSLKNAGWVDIIIFKAAGTAGDDPDFTLYQATDVAGTSAKVASIITTIYKKQGTLSSVTAWTEETQAASEVYSANATSAEEQAIYVIHVEADQLDTANSFDCIRVDAADVGTNAQLGCVLYMLGGLRKATAPASLPDPLAD